jgi:LysM repeat protein
MKILKIFGIVVGIHLFALILIFANPGCSSTTKTTPSPGDTASDADESPIVAAPDSGARESTAEIDPGPTSSAITFHPDTPAAAAPVIDTGVRYSPTRPGTPVAGALLAEPVADVTPVTTYTVKSGDNLWTIARRNNLTLAQLMSANNLSGSAVLHPGQKLIIPGRSRSADASTASTGVSGSSAKAAPVANATSRSDADSVKHVVKSGETLGAIARKYGVRQGDLAVANNISDPGRIRPGQELVIPGWKAPGSKGTQATEGAANVSPSSPAPVDVLPAPSTPSNSPPVPVIQIDENPAAPKEL